MSKPISVKLQFKRRFGEDVFSSLIKSRADDLLNEYYFNNIMWLLKGNQRRYRAFEKTFYNNVTTILCRQALKDFNTRDEIIENINQNQDALGFLFIDNQVYYTWR